MTWKYPTREEACLTCAEKFEGRWARVDRKYCSPKCRQKAHRERGKAKREAALTKKRKASADREARILERHIASQAAKPKKRRSGSPARKTK